MKKFFLILVISCMIVNVGQYKNEIVFAAARKKVVKNIEEADTLTKELDRLSREFVKRERIPNSVVRAGDIYVLRSATSQFMTVCGEGAAIFSEPNVKSKRIVKLYDGTELIAEAEFVGYSGSDWYYVIFRDDIKGWVDSKFLVSSFDYESYEDEIEQK